MIPVSENYLWKTFFGLAFVLTGTFCTLDISLSRLVDIHTVDICNTVRRMRAQRAFSIQTPDQYEFCYFAIIEYAQRASKLGVVDFSGYDDSDSDSD